MHKLSIGIVGLPNVGKSTLFKILTKQEINIANYPFTTIEPNVGIVPVPDKRLQKLSEITGIQKTVPAIVEFYDIAGLVKGANKGEGLGNQFLAHIRETDVLVIVLRAFENSEVSHVESEINPLHDLEIINAELVMKDLETIEKTLEKLEHDVRGGDKKAAKHTEILEAISEKLNQDKNILEHAHEEIVKQTNLLTAKKQIYLFNGENVDIPPELATDSIVINLAEAKELPELIQKAYKTLGLISFFTTTGEKEVHAWTIKEGMKLPQAAGTIHTDFEKKFIRAEIIAFQKLEETGDWNTAKQKGLIRTEGKEYVVQDGDVVVVRHG